MADSASIERVAKILAKATSENAAEADLAIRHAFGRMQRDGVTFGDLLSLPKDRLFQSTLSRLAELLSRELKPDLSENAKRELYGALLKMVVDKFADDLHSEPKGTADQEREEAARAYEERRRQEEARRGRTEPPPRHEEGRGEPPPMDANAEQAQSRQNAKTASWGDIEPPLRFDAGRFPLAFSGTTYLAFLFGRGSFLRCIFTYPKLAFFLMARSFVVGGIIATVLYVGMALVLKHYWQGAPLRWVFLLLFDPPASGFLLIMLGIAYVLYERSWYPDGPRPGQTDSLSIARSLGQLSLALIWRAYGMVIWLGNIVYIFGYRWKMSREQAKSSKPEPQREETNMKKAADEKTLWGFIARYSDTHLTRIIFVISVYAFAYILSLIGLAAVYFSAFLYFRWSLSDSQRLALLPFLQQDVYSHWVFVRLYIFMAAVVVATSLMFANRHLLPRLRS